MITQLRQYACRSILAFALYCALCLAIRAQDVTVTTPQWNEPVITADMKLPQFKKSPKDIDYPAHLDEANVQGYVIVRQYVDAKGKGGECGIRATQPHFVELVREATKAGVTFRPATANNDEIASDIWYALIFNPRTASKKRSDAEPRLLEVTPIFVDKSLLGNLRDRDIPVLWGKVDVDESGKVTAVIPDAGISEKIVPIIIKSVTENWRYAPARKAGVSVAATTQAAFLCMATPQPVGPEPLNLADLDVMPQPISRAEPIYPFEMKNRGIPGEAILQFIVNAKGNVEDVTVVRTTHKFFGDAATDAVSKWRFKPGIKRGKPVSTRMQIPIAFALDGDNGINGYTVDREVAKKLQDKLPPEYRFDVAPKPNGTVPIITPYTMLLADKKGKARVGFIIGADGKIKKTYIVSATPEECGYALVAALDAFSFEPALRDRRPTATFMSTEIEFPRADQSYEWQTEQKRLLSYDKKKSDKIVSANKLDTKLTPKSLRAPVYPSSMAAESKAGNAEIEFLVNEEGRVFLPRIVSASSPEFGYAGAQAVSEWQFESPTSGGKKVITRVRVPLDFKPNEIAPEAATDTKPNETTQTKG